MSFTDNPRLRSVVARVKALILHPSAEWDVIDLEPATVKDLFTRYVLILAAIPPVCTTLGGLIFGYGSRWWSFRPSPLSLMISGLVQYGLGLVGVYVMGLIIEALAPSFGGNKDRIAAMKVAAYFPTAFWLAGVFGLIPALGILTIVGLYSLYLLYLGLPKLMRAPADKALVYTIVVIVAAIVVEAIIGALLTAISVSLLTTSHTGF
jgi:hypothetical protein